MVLKLGAHSCAVSYHSVSDLEPVAIILISAQFLLKNQMAVIYGFNVIFLFLTV